MRRIFIFALVSGCFADSEPVADDVGVASESSESGGESVSSTTSGTVGGTTAGPASGSETASESGSDSGSDSEDGGTSGSEDSTEGSGESSGSTGEPHLPYQPCSPDDTSLCAPDEICIHGEDVLLGDQVGWCSKACQDGNNATDCPEAQDGNAVLTCTYYTSELPLRCLLRCPSGETCPTGTTCHIEFYMPDVDGSYAYVCA